MPKRIKKILGGAVLFAACFLLPHLAHAMSFETVNGKVVGLTEKNSYRYRHDTKPWQLATVNPENISQPVVVNSQLFVVSQADGQAAILVTKNGLAYQPIVPLQGEAAHVVSHNGGLFAAVLRDGVVRSYQLKADSQLTELTASQLAQLSSIDQLFTLNNRLFFPEQAANLTKLWEWVGTNWQLATALDCPNFSLVRQPLTGLICNGQTLIFSLNGSDWSALFPGQVKNIATSPLAIAAVDAGQSNRLYFYRDNQLFTFDLPLQGKTISKISLFGARVFLSLSDGTVSEFDPLSQSLLPSLNPSPVFIPTQNADRLFYRSGADYWFSDAPGAWQAVTVEGDFDAVLKVGPGWLAWKTNGSLSQFSSDGSSFRKIATSWAAASKIQAVTATGTSGLVLLLNGSGNPNLYRTNDYAQWTRVTLPTAPTHSVSLTAARLLPAGSLVEVEGSISAGKGVVSADTLYLQDELSGIQVYLATSKGSLPSDSNKRAIATGEISTSQTKRILLDELTDLELGAQKPVTLQNLSINDVANRLGWTAITEAKVTEAASDSLSLATNTGSIKLHFASKALDFQKEDTIRLPFVGDWNSASGKVEMWYLGANAQLVDRPPVAQNVEADTVAAISSSVSVPAVASTSVSSSAQPTRKAQLVASSTLAAAESLEELGLGSSAVLPTKVAAVSQTNKAGQTTVMIIVSFAAGILATLGRRFRLVLRF